MPNLDFYAIGSDLDAVVDVAFAQPGCRIFESYSRPGHDLVEFTTADQLRAALMPEPVAHSGQQLTLHIAVPGAPFTIRRFAVDPQACKGHAFRHNIEGWGLIQFYLGGPSVYGVVNSHTNHNSQARALAWEPVITGPSAVEQWDWRTVSAVSSRMNRMIRKLAVAKIGSRPVLPEAAAEVTAGARLVGWPDPPPLELL